MRLYMHIGVHKTGTTAVQHFLTANRERLRDQGVTYARSGCPPREAILHGQHMLAWEITRPKSGRQGTWDTLREELEAEDGDVAVVSTEEFDARREPDQFSALRSHLDGLDVRIVVYLRRQDEFLHSYYCTDVLFHREARDFDEYRQTLKTDADYRVLLSRWEEAFGREALSVRTYDKSKLRDGDIVSDLCDEVGIDLADAGLSRPPSQRQINRAYPRNVISCVLWARRAGMSEGDIASLRYLFNLVYRDQSSEVDLLSPADRLELLGEYEESNRAVARRYLDRDALFDEPDLSGADAWAERYAGDHADLTSSLDDAREAFARLEQRARPRGGGPAREPESNPNGAPADTSEAKEPGRP